MWRSLHAVLCVCAGVLCAYWIGSGGGAARLPASRDGGGVRGEGREPPQRSRSEEAGGGFARNGGYGLALGPCRDSTIGWQPRGVKSEHSRPDRARAARIPVRGTWAVGGRGRSLGRHRAAAARTEDRPWLVRPLTGHPLRGSDYEIRSRVFHVSYTDPEPPEAELR
eukprot:2124180-Prymnesium_polylepis.2